MAEPSTRVDAELSEPGRRAGRSFIRVRSRPTPTQLGVVSAVCLVVIVATSVAAADGEVDGFEAAILRWFNDWPEAVEPVLWFLEQVGNLFFPLAAGLACAIAARRWTLIIPFALILPLKLFFEKTVVKGFVERERPYTSLGDDIIVREGAFEGLSFPSGHTTTAFATAVLLAALLPRLWRLVPIVWAVLVGVARMFMGEHNFYDVVCGAALGTLFATLLWYFVLADDRIGGPVVSEERAKPVASSRSG